MIETLWSWIAYWIYTLIAPSSWSLLFLRSTTKNSKRTQQQNSFARFSTVSFFNFQGFQGLVATLNLLSFTPLQTQKIKIWNKRKKWWEISFYKCVPEMTIIWCMGPEIWSVTDIIFCHCGLIFILLPH